MPADPSPKKTRSSQRVIVGRRLAYYRQVASAKYWDDVWARHETQQLYEEAAQGELGYYEDIFPRYLTKAGKVLEAGCGLGQFVIALRKRGYDAEGVDYGEQTVTMLNAKFPDLPIRWGDVTNLDVPDGYYQGYISLGVMEHIKEGPQVFLSEAFRILAPGGVALISTPYQNGLRRLKMRLGFFGHEVPKDLDFYQYAYSEKEFDEYLRSAGFTPAAHHQYGGYKGIKDEIPWLTKLFNLPQLGWRLNKFLMHWKWADNHMGHMMMYVCLKEA